MDIRVALVMPAYDAAPLLPTTVPALLAAARGAETVVVDAGSTDETAAVAASYDGVRVVRMPRQVGPAAARNAGAGAVDADVVLFVDSDCVATPDLADRVRAAFAADPELVTLTGSYDDSPADPGFFSQYMNLRHHHTHQRARREDATFWAACGAVRLQAFRAVGGFDEELFPRPMIEDIELGVRMKQHGHTHLDPDLQVKHLKRWTLWSVIVTDIFCRAIPWTRLIVRRQGLPDDLNLRRSQRLAAAVAPLALLSVPALPALAAVAPRWTVVPLAVLALSWALSADLVHFFWRRRGPWFAVRAWLFHQVHLVYSAVTFVVLSVTARR